MLGASYLLSLTLQHYVFLGLVLVFTIEVLIKVKGLSELNALYEHVGLLGLSFLNLAFLHYSLTEELFLVQTLLLILMILLLLTNTKIPERLNRNENNLVYIVLALILFIELTN